MIVNHADRSTSAAIVSKPGASLGTRPKKRWLPTYWKKQPEKINRLASVIDTRSCDLPRVAAASPPKNSKAVANDQSPRPFTLGG